MATTTATQIEADNAESAEADEGKAPVVKRKLSLKLILMAVGGLVALSLIGGGTYYFFFAGKKEPVANAANQIKPPVFLDMPDVLVNLSSTGGERTHAHWVSLDTALTAHLNSWGLKAGAFLLLPKAQ